MAEDMQATIQDAAQATPTVDDLKVKYGDKLYRIKASFDPDDDTTINVDYVFVRPSVASYDRYMKTASNGMTKALQTFLNDSVTEEYRAKLTSDLNEYPALALTIGEKLLAMMGLSKDINLKRL